MPNTPIRVAIVTTVWRYLSHAQHIGDRFLIGYPVGGRWHKPPVQVVSLYVDQKPEGDQSAERAKEFGFGVFPTIAEALRGGGNQLACDAVLIIGEHGKYAVNEKGQVLYPRHEFFQQCVAVFEQDGRAVPVFNDKHLSYSFEKAKWMVEAARRLKFPLLAGSSLPVTWRLPDVEMPANAVVEEAVMVGNGGTDVMGFHALEAMQCMLERRRGGESGVRSVHTLQGDEVWKAGDQGRWSKRLLKSALSRSDSPQGFTIDDGRTQDLMATGELPRLVAKPLACLIEYQDGVKAALLMLNGAVKDFTFAARLRGRTQPLSTQFFLSPVPNVTYSACLVHKIEEMFVTGRAPYPVERTLLTSGLTEACLDSLAQGKRIDTPHLAVKYRPPAQSQHMRT
jgi:hypothetical protein